MKRIDQWLKLSFLVDNDEKSRKAVLIYASIMACIFLIIIIVAGDLIGEKTPKLTLMADGLTFFILLGLLYLLSKGKVSLAGAGLVIFSIILVSVGIISLGTVRTPTTSIYLLIILIAGMLFNTKGLIYSVIAICLILLGLFLAENNSLLRQPDFSVTLTQWITYTIIFIMCGSLSTFWVKTLREALANLNREITAREILEYNLKESLKEKETLLKEIHHRVKNNMNVVSSLLSLHKNSTQNEEVKKALQESQGRVYAMSAVHEALYKSGNLAEIDLTSYIKKLTGTLIQTYSINPDKIQLKVTGDDIKVTIDNASPLGLTINELISNALKYAFPDNQTGKIEVTLRKQGNQLLLTISDNGIGLPPGLDWKQSNTLGLNLVRTLVESQLEGFVDFENKNGTSFRIGMNLKNEV